MTAGTAVLVYAPTLGTNDGWGSIAFVACLLVSVVLLVAFVLVERRSRQPIMPLSIFRHHTLAVGDAIMVLAGAWLAGEVLVLSLYSQEVLGYSPLVAGLVAIPQGVGGLLRGLVAARLLERTGLKWFLAGNWVLAAVSISLLFRSNVTSHNPVLGLVLLGIGFGSTNAGFGGTVAGTTGVPNTQQGVAGALVNSARQIGAAIGVAVVLSVVALDAGTATSSADRAAGYRLALLCWAGIGVAAALLSLALPGRPRTDRQAADARTPATRQIGANHDRHVATERCRGRDPRSRRRPHGASPRIRGDAHHR